MTILARVSKFDESGSLGFSLLISMSIPFLLYLLGI